MLYVNSCCCTCLSTENLQTIHQRDAENVKILDKLLFCLTEKDSIFEYAPLLICERCCRNIQEIYIFKKAAMKNLDLFRNCLKQLIKNPFSDLRIAMNDKQLGAGQSSDYSRQLNPSDNLIQNTNNPNLVANVQIGAIVKLEQTDNNFDTFDEYLPVEVDDATRHVADDPGQNQNYSLKIHNVESLNKNYRKHLINPKASSLKNSVKKTKTKKVFRKKTICHPCGKKFIRDDFFINHILSCSKSDIKTKKNVLNWVSKTTRKKVVTGQIQINPTTLRVMNSTLHKKNVDEIVKHEPEIILEENQNSKVAPKTSINSRKEKYERTVCHLCKRRITIRFFRRHYIRCIKLKEEEKKVEDLLTLTPKNEAKQPIIATV